MAPYIKYYIGKNPEFGKKFSPLTEQQFEIIRGYSGNKMCNSYEQYIEVAKRQHAALCEIPESIFKASIASEDDITEAEKREDFIRWFT